MSQEFISLLEERSVLGLVFSSADIAALLGRNYLRSAQAGTPLVNEGDLATDLIIPLKGNMGLQSKGPSGERFESGTVVPGRSINLYSVLRGLPFQYAAIAKEDCEYLQIPWSDIKAKVEAVPNLTNYLTLIADPLFRHLAREMDEIGCDKHFRVQLLGSLRKIEISPQVWVTHHGQPLGMAFYLVNGGMHAYQKARDGNLVSLWQTPLRSWQNWEDCIAGKGAAHGFRAFSTCELLTIGRDRLLEIRAQYPEDFELFNKNLIQAIHAPSSDSEDEDSEEGEEVESLAELFSNAVVHSKKKFRWNYPFVRQNDMMDCGPACLAMVSKYFGNEISIQSWRELVQTDREGTSLFNLAAAAERNGFVCHGIGVDDIQTVERQLFPLIALRKYHYVVVYAIKGKNVIIGDPGAGIRRIPITEFEEGFENCVLLLKPMERFYDVQDSPSRFAHYAELFKGFGREISLVIACSLVLMVMSLFPPLLTQIMMDEVLSKKDGKLLLILLAGAAAVIVSQVLMNWIRSYYLSFIASKFDFKASSAFLRKTLSLPYGFLMQRHVGDFTRRLSEMDRLREFLTTHIVSSLLNVTTLGFYGIILALYSPTVAIATFVLAPMLMVLASLFSRKFEQAYQETFASRAEQESLVTDFFEGAGLIKATSSELASRWRYDERLVKTLRARYQFALTDATLRSVIMGVHQLMRFGIMGLAAYLGLKGELTPGQVLSLSLLVNNVFEPFSELARSWSVFQETKAAALRLNDVFLAKSETVPSRKGLSGVSKGRLRGDIEFVGVSFRYGGEASEWVLKDVSFKIEAGQNVAVIGPSGSGKSTIAYLINRLYHPTQGQILIDGRDVREYDLKWLRTQIGFIFQESHLFHGSISENIAFSTPIIDTERVISAARTASAHDFIMKKSAGYSYHLTHRGLGLSGGEKQRVALARALYGTPSIFVLDEATSSLDGLSERELLKSLRSTAQGRTVVSIAHRHSTIRMSDFALLMNQGRMVGFGTHDWLAKNNILYAELLGLDAPHEKAAG